MTVADVFSVIEVTQPTYHRWKQQYGGMQAEEARPGPIRSHPEGFPGAFHPSSLSRPLMS